LRSVAQVGDDRLVSHQVSCQLVVRYGGGDAAASMECLRSHGVTDISDMLIRGPLALCIARPSGKTRAELDQLLSCLRAAGALVTEQPDDQQLTNAAPEE